MARKTRASMVAPEGRNSASLHLVVHMVEARGPPTRSVMAVHSICIPESRGRKEDGIPPLKE